MALQFEGPNSGWELSCDGCWDLMFMHEYPDWDGVTYADAQCHECVQLQQEDEDE